MVRANRTAAVRRRLISADEYQRMGRAGIIHEDDRVELLDGELYDMGALGSRHIGCVIRLSEWWWPRVAGRAHVSVQNAVRLSKFSEPQPDIALLRPRADFYESAHPTPEDILLIIEVADSSLRYDRDVKLPRYARAGIADVWLVDLPRRRVTVYRDPSGDRYATATVHTRGSVLTPLAFPDLSVPWEAIFG